MLIAIVIVIAVIVIAAVSGSPGAMSMGPSITEMYENKDCNAFQNYLNTHTQVEIQESMAASEAMTYMKLTTMCLPELMAP